jgi:hypothetical protein
MHGYLSRGIVLENLFRSQGVVTTSCDFVVASLVFVFSFFGLCASMIARLALDIMLLQRLGAS